MAGWAYDTSNRLCEELPASLQVDHGKMSEDGQDEQHEYINPALLVAFILSAQTHNNNIES